MKKFISFISTTLTLLGLLALFVVAFIFILSTTSNVNFKNTITSAKSFGEEIKESITSTISAQKDLITLSEEENNHVVVKNDFNNYYFNQLDDNSKIIYSALEKNIDSLKKDNYVIDFSTTFNDLLNTSNGQYSLNKSFQSALDAFFYDHPELFYIDLTKISLVINYTTLGSKTTYKVSLAPENGTNYLYSYFKSKEEVNTAISKVENIRKNLISSVANYDDYNKVLKVHDVLANSLKYSSKSKYNAHNIYGALVEKEVVCEGYAKAFKYILDGLNIECILVSGTAINSSSEQESHMWNYIKLNNNWYGVDVTWDDPIVLNNPSKNVIKHTYFLKGNNVFDEDHFIDNKISNNGMSFTLPTLSYNNYK